MDQDNSPKHVEDHLPDLARVLEALDVYSRMSLNVDKYRIYTKLCINSQESLSSWYIDRLKWANPVHPSIRSDLFFSRNAKNIRALRNRLAHGPADDWHALVVDNDEIVTDFLVSVAKLLAQDQPQLFLDMVQKSLADGVFESANPRFLAALTQAVNVAGKQATSDAEEAPSDRQDPNQDV
jgi:hypothetical protein